MRLACVLVSSVMPCPKPAHSNELIPPTGIAMCQNAVAVVGLQGSAYGYKQLSQGALRDGRSTPESGPSSQFRLLYARLRTSIGRGQ